MILFVVRLCARIDRYMSMLLAFADGTLDASATRELELSPQTRTVIVDGRTALRNYSTAAWLRDLR